MSRLDDAEMRLTAAIERLEEALASAPKGNGDPEMAAALAQARAEYAALREKADAAGGRLDETIGRLRTILGDGRD